MENIFEAKKKKFLELSFSDSYSTTHTLEEAQLLPVGTENVSVAGRVVSLRILGKLLFAVIQDIFGRLQIAVKVKDENSETFQLFKENVSVGDFVGVKGKLFLTRTEELTLDVDSFKFLNKALRPLPEKYHGMENQELIYRQRYLDVITNLESRNLFQKRLLIQREMRRFFEDNGFAEVETPILQNVASGALAKPFYTAHNALDISCVLRIAPETYLKRYIGAGFPRVYEFAKCFRNEGISTVHLQEFTMLEFYASYWNSENMRDYVERLARHIIFTVLDLKQLVIDGVEVSLEDGHWEIIKYLDLIKKHTDIDLDQFKDSQSLFDEIKRKDIHVEGITPKTHWFQMVDSLYKKKCRPFLIKPCFIVDYPMELGPLSRRKPNDPTKVDFFQFIIGGVELAKGYSELVDPLDQEQRFIVQQKARDEGDTEAMPLDKEYLLAMEHGFPPIAGCGIGIDRFIMTLLNCDNIKDTLLFPLLRPVE